jgi:hypothetical protein
LGTTDKQVLISDLSDAQLSNLNAYFTRMGPNKDFTVEQFHKILAEILRRANVRSASDATEGSARRPAAKKEETCGAAAADASPTGQMTLNEAIAAAKVEGYAYDKHVARHYQEAMRQSPLELRIEKKTYDRAVQGKLAKGHYDMAVMLSTHAEGIQQALDEKGAGGQRKKDKYRYRLMVPVDPSRQGHPAKSHNCGIAVVNPKVGARNHKVEAHNLASWHRGSAAGTRRSYDCRLSKFGRNP